MGKWNDVFVVAGPTAGGKSDFAIELAENWDAEIVSADAYQIYRGLAVLTAQPSADQQTRVPHHLVNLLDPTEDFSAADFARLASVSIAEIRLRKKRIVVVGGAGFYLEALFDGLAESPAPPPELRSRLREMALPDLVAELRERDPAAAATVDLRNPRRVQRAIEVIVGTGRPFADSARQPDFSVRGLVLNPARETLLERIASRALRMLEEGAIEEVQRLGLRGQTCGQAIGLAEIEAFLAGKITRAEGLERIIIATRQYAKRQLTWFRNRARWELVTPERAQEHAAGMLAE